MDPVTLSVLSGAGGLMSGISSLLNNAPAKQAAITRAQESIENSATAENLRRAQGNQAQTAGSAIAATAGTGFMAGQGTFNTYLSDMAEQFQNQNAFTRMQGMQKADLLEKEATAEEPNWLTRGLNFGSTLLGAGTNIATAANKPGGK